MSPGFINSLAVELRLCIYSPGDFLVYAGHIAKEFYILVKGKARITDLGYHLQFLELLHSG